MAAAAGMEGRAPAWVKVIPGAGEETPERMWAWWHHQRLVRLSDARRSATTRCYPTAHR